MLWLCVCYKFHGRKLLVDKQITTPCGAVIEVDLKVQNIKNGVSKKVTLKSADLISIGK